MVSVTDRTPNPDEIRREVAEFLKEKYGDRVVVPPDADEVGNHPGDKKSEGQVPPQVSFNLKPTALEQYLAQFVIGQEEAIEVLATKICTHFNRMKIETDQNEIGELVGRIKSNILMIGPTGVGKTYLIKLIAKKIGVPFVKGDATKFSETGYVGGDVEDLVRALVHEADGDIKLAENGIIYLDEIDKIASSGGLVGPDVSRTGVQRNLLKLMEESEVDLKTPHDLASQMEAAMEAQRTGKVTRKKINTRNILFVMSGAFSDLPDIIRRRLNQQPLGFQTKEYLPSNSNAEVQLLRLVRSEDLIKFGFESEFVGRLPVVVSLNDLDVQGLYDILKNPNSSVVLAKKHDFQAYGIDIEFNDEALQRIAELAFEEHTGARGLASVVDRVLMKYEKLLPDTDIPYLTVTRQIVDNPQKELTEILNKYYLKSFQKRFLAANGIVITFTPKALEMLLEKARQKSKNFEQVCSDMLRDYEYGLRLLNCDKFTVDEDIVRNPKQRLEKLIKEAYQPK
jgi:ATP-dependent Clp protease ATP-binding subunit ClpX